ncbi:hypothetical protein B0O99DRAFT_214834 [Bisporella sp. PMI_857]|nr:hypothetical protein B0O99DRAFT_214834 [Bisporella sp. PMI_857]
MKNFSFLGLCLLGSLCPAIAHTAHDAKRQRAGSSDGNNIPACAAAPITLSLNTPPNMNYLYSDCNVGAEVVVSNSQLLVAWPAGNSGAQASFAPRNGGDLTIDLINSTVGSPLGPVYAFPQASSGVGYPSVGVTGVLRFSSAAVLSRPILGSIRTIRNGQWNDPRILDATNFTAHPDGSASVQRIWLDNVTTTSFHFSVANRGTRRISVANQALIFDAGDYIFSAELDYPQMTQMPPSKLLNSESQGLISQQPDQTAALSFLSYTEKLLAGSWTYLTYFGRDSMLSALLLEPVFSTGNNSAMEAVIGAALERLNRTDGSVCHEEIIGDYATWVNEDAGLASVAMSCDYKMVDTDYYLPVLMQRYFLQTQAGSQRVSEFLSTPAGSVNAANQNLTWGQLSTINSERIMRLAGPFAENQTIENLIHLKDGEVVGEWRDSRYGIGDGRIPFSVNTALVPAALRSIAALARAGVYSQSDWAELADRYAKVWEDKTLAFFEVTISKSDAVNRVATYATSVNFAGPNQTNTIDDDVHFYAVALNGSLNGDALPQVAVMHSDDCFRHFLLNTTNQSQLTAFVNQTANNLRHTFPTGLMTDAGMIVANPAYGGDPAYAQYFTNTDYHGTVIWSWQLAMMAKGLELQLSRCAGTSQSSSSGDSTPDFCTDDIVYNNVKDAYNLLWDIIEENTSQLSKEVWSWNYSDGKFQVAPYSGSNIWQLWSLTFLAVTRNKDLSPTSV